MIALDTNILVRYFVRDDRRQAAAAKRLLEDQLTAADPGFVSLAVVSELSWVLGQVYGLSTENVREIVQRLLRAVEIEIESATVLEAAVGHRHGDLADAILHEIGVQRGCSATLTFDRKFARLSGVGLLETAG